MRIAANIRKLSRVELLYTCVAELVIYCHHSGLDSLIEGLESYYDPNDFNKKLYYSDGSDTKKWLSAILQNVDKLLESCITGFDDVTECPLLIRCLFESTVVKEALRRMRTKEDPKWHDFNYA